MSPSLRSLDVLAVDCQSTGASPRHGHLLEVGWARARADRDDAAVAAYLVAQPEGAVLPPRIARLTGIADDELDSAIAPAEAWRLLRAEADSTPAHGPRGVPVAVIHFARFERAFLSSLHKEIDAGHDFPFDVVCTHDIAVRLFPALPRRGLRALAGCFGYSLPPPRRCSEHVAATVFVWRHLVACLADQGIADHAALASWLANAPPRRKAKEYPMPRSSRLAAPDAPGVYRMLRKNGDLLYIGKATSLKKRVNSYFQKQSKIAERTLEMLAQARDLEMTVTESALEAAILESDEVKRCAPPYNVALMNSGRTVTFVGRAGPLRSDSDVWALLLIARCAALDVASPLLWLFTNREAPEPECLAAGFSAFCAEHTLDQCTTEGTLRRLAARMWQRRLDAEDARADEDADEDEDEDESDGEQAAEAESPPEWTPARVARALSGMVRRAGHAIRRGSWLRRLSEATIAFTESNWTDTRTRGLWISGGAIVRAAWLDSPCAPLPIVSIRARQARAGCVFTFNLATYDRLRVLSTELRRLSAQGARLEVRLPKASLSGDRLHRALRWV